VAHPPIYFAPYVTLFPLWPTFDKSVAIGLAALVLSMLLLPRLLGLVVALANRERRVGFGGALRLSIGFLVELVLSTLMAPITMLLQSGFVFSILLGRTGGWRAQSRDGDGINWVEGCIRLGWQSLVGIALTIFVARAAPELTWWLVPLLAGLTLAVPLAVLTTSGRLSALLARVGLLWTPEETDPPYILSRTRQLHGSWQEALGVPQTALGSLAADRRLLALHLALLSSHSDWQVVDAETLAAARDKLAGGADAAQLDRAEVTALLFDPAFLEALAAGEGLASAARIANEDVPALPAAA
jgi:membrane glycosyltransferase